MRAPGCVPDCTSISRGPSSVSSCTRRAERGLHDRNREPVPEVVAAALERRVRRDVHRDEEIAGRRRRAARPDRGRRAEAAGRRRCRRAPRRRSSACPSTRPSPRHVAHGCSIVVPRPAHVGHGPGGHDLAEQRPPHLANLAGAVAGRAARRLRAGHAARAVARLALDRHAHLDRAPHAGDDLGERELHHRLGVGTAARAGRAAAAEHVAAEERVEEIVETELARRERVAGRARAPPSGAEHVVLAAALGIAHRLVRGVDLLEAVGRGRDRRDSRRGGTRARAGGTRA